MDLLAAHITDFFNDLRLPFENTSNVFCSSTVSELNIAPKPQPRSLQMFVIDCGGGGEVDPEIRHPEPKTNPE